jgi:uridine kinase
MRQQQRLAGESFLVAVSGIDGSGKGYITAQVVAGLRQRGFRVAGINIDGWLNLPHLRFNKRQPAEHFYQYAIRFDEMFQQFVLPLKRQRSICMEMDFVEETARTYRKHTYDFQNVEIIVLEGIYLLKSIYRQYYDWTLWVDCSFETALERALQRGQEGLPPDETIQAYQSIYFPAQEIHFRVDAPRSAADCILINDPRLEPEGA